MKFKTEDDLRLLDAAKELLRRFKSREIKAKEFDMSTFGSTHCNMKTGECGTVHCLGGWLSVIMGFEVGNPSNYLDLSVNVITAANNLFFPSDYKMKNSKKKRGVQALENFIRGNKNPWRGVEV